MKIKNLLTSITIVLGFLLIGCENIDPVPSEILSDKSQSLSSDFDANDFNANARISQSTLLGSASDFAVLAGTTVTNGGASVITGDLGVSPGTAITGFEPSPINTISGPGTVTAGLGIVNGTIYPGGPVAAQAHNDATVAYNNLIAQTPDIVYAGVIQLDGMTFTPGVYNFSPSANLQVNGTVYLDFQGNNEALFIFQTGSTLVTMSGSNVVALNYNNQDCSGSNVYWAVGSSATIDGAQFIGTVIAYTTITMTSDVNVSGRILALNGAVTMINETIGICPGSMVDSKPAKECRDFITGGGWIEGTSKKATFGVSGGIKNGKYWGQLSFNNHDSANGVKVKSYSVTSYQVIDAVTRQIEGMAKVNGQGTVAYKVVISDNGEPGTNDTFKLELSDGYSIDGVLQGGNIQLHTQCGKSNSKGNKEEYSDNYENEGNKSSK